MPEPWRSARAACVARCLHEKREPGVLWRTEVGELPMGTAALEQLRELLGHNQAAPVAKNPPASAEDAGDAGSVPGSGGPPGGAPGNPLQDSCLENPMDRAARRATVHEVAESWT